MQINQYPEGKFTDIEHELTERIDNIMATITKEQIKAGLDLIRAVADSIKAAGEIPSGHLYSMMMSHICLAEYERIIGILKNAGVISESNNLLKWNL